MENTYHYSWIIPFIPLPIPIFIAFGLLVFPRATKKFRRMWAFQSIFLLSLAMIFSIDICIQQINTSSINQYVWSWTINNDFSFEFGYFIDSLTSIMLILITTVGVLVLIYSDNYMSHDQGYLRFFAYLSLFTTSMLALVISANLIQIYICWELIGLCSYLLIGFWFTRPLAAIACQKAFVTNRVGDFGLLLGILGLYWITGSFEFQDLFEILNNLIYKNDSSFLFATFCAFLIFAGAIAKSAQFPLHVWLPDAMEGPTPISALIHAATMVAAGIFLVARFLPLFIAIPYIMNIISFIGIITVLLGATLALAQKDIKKGLAYSTISQLGYMMVALGMGSYRTAVFHLITHAYSKALLFLGSGSIIHSMETILGYSPNKSQNMAFMGGLKKHIPITKIAFLVGTLSLCGIPPFACFWSKDEILNDSWFYSPIFAIILYATAGLTAFYMFRIYLLIFEGHLNIDFQNYSGKKNSSLYSINLWGKEEKKRINTNFGLLLVLTLNNNEESSSFWKRTRGNAKNNTYITISHLGTRSILFYPHESGNTILFPMLGFVLLTLIVGVIGISFNQEEDILSKLLTPSINLLHKNSNGFVDWSEFLTNATFSISIAFFGIVLAYLLYNPFYSSFQNLNILNSFGKEGTRRVFLDKIKNAIYDWSYNRGSIDAFYSIALIQGIRGLAELTHFFDRRVIDGLTNGVGITSFFLGEGIRYVGGSRISSYLLFYLFYVFLFLVMDSLIFI